MAIFIIEDNTHSEWCGEFSSYKSALKDLEEKAKIPWNKVPNKCPCQSWKTCKRLYEIVEFEDKISWKVVNRGSVLEVSSKGIVWYK